MVQSRSMVQGSSGSNVHRQISFIRAGRFDGPQKGMDEFPSKRRNSLTVGSRGRLHHSCNIMPWQYSVGRNLDKIFYFNQIWLGGIASNRPILTHTPTLSQTVLQGRFETLSGFDPHPTTLTADTNRTLWESYLCMIAMSIFNKDMSKIVRRLLNGSTPSCR